MRELLVSLLLLCCQLSFAGVVTWQEAQKKATAFIQQQHITAIAPHRANTFQENISENKAEVSAHYYAFNIGEKGGFVVVSSDDRTPAILGYTEEGEFNAETIPSNMKAWLEGYNEQLAYLKQHPDAITNRVSFLDEHESIRPLLSSNWNQDAPYNNLCPKDGTEPSVTGCVATAMAQVMYYHQYPAKTTVTIPAYTTYTKNIKVSSIGVTTINWANMLDRYNNSETTVQKNAVATLMKLCGASIEMDYTSKASGAASYLVPIALKKYFDYDKATTLVIRDDYRARDWDKLIYNELSRKRPVYYSGTSTGGGHAFVIDGYYQNGFYHVNWGWGGASNGYFLLSILDPDNHSGIGASSSTDGYSFEQEAMIGAQPNTGEEPDIEVKLSTTDISTQQTSVALTSRGYPVTLNAAIYNQMEGTYTFDMGLGVYNSDNEQLDALWIYSNSEIMSGWGWHSLELSEYVPELPDGTYQLIPISRETGTDTWYRNAGKASFFIEATISNKVMKLQSPTINLAAEMETSGNNEVGSPVITTTTITNKGTLFLDQLFLLANKRDVGGRYFELDGGETDTLEMTYIPEEEGTTILQLGYYHEIYDDETGWERIFETVATKTITIEEAKVYNFSFSNGRVTNAKGTSIKDTKACLQFDILNNGENNYKDNIIAYALSKENDGYFYVRTDVLSYLDLAAGESKTVNIEVPLNQDGYYWFIVSYKTEGEYIDIGEKTCYRALYGYNVAIPEVPSDIKNISSNSQKSTNPKIYNLNGQKLKTPRKGLNIINGRKVVVK